MSITRSDSRRGRDSITLISVKANTPASFLVFILPATRSPSALYHPRSFFVYTSARYTRHRRVSARGASFRNPRQWRRGFAGTKTFLRRLKSHSTRSLSFSFTYLPWNGKLFGFPFSSDSIGVAPSRVTVRDRVPSCALHVDLAVNSWILSITQKYQTFNLGNLRNVFRDLSADVYFIIKCPHFPQVNERRWQNLQFILCKCVLSSYAIFTRDSICTFPTRFCFLTFANEYP